MPTYCKRWGTWQIETLRPAHIIAQAVALPPGTLLGVCEVADQIGEGGMGQVYRATDTKLEREVAVKVLP